MQPGKAAAPENPLHHETKGREWLSLQSDLWGVLMPLEPPLEIAVAERQIAVAPGVSFSIALSPDSGDPVCAEYLAGGLYHSNLLFLMLHQIKPGQTVVDLGAHIGTFALTAAAAGCKVVAVEANPYNAALLNRSVASNEFEHLKVFNVVASDKPGTVDFMCHGPWGSIFVDSTKEVRKVPAVAVGQLLSELGIEHVEFLKIDVEGSELEALAGMRTLLNGANAPMVLYESNGFQLEYAGHRPQDLHALFAELGYRQFFVENTRLTEMWPGDVQFDSCSDILAVKGALSLPEGWEICQRPSREQTLARIVSLCSSQHESFRGWCAHVLQDADPFILASPQISDLFTALKKDPSQLVRQRSSWWEPNTSRRAALKCKGLRVLHLSSWNSPCGIAGYAADLIRQLDRKEIINTIFPVSVRQLKWMGSGDMDEKFENVVHWAEGYDLVHIQHEFSFFGGAGGFLSSCRRYSRVLKNLKRLNIGVITTFHTEPDFSPLDGSVKARVKALLRWLTWRWYVAPHFRGAESRCIAVVHTRKTRLAMLRGGLSRNWIRVIPMGHQLRSIPYDKEGAKRKLGLPEGSVLLSLFGFVSTYKGHLLAVQTLRKLPPNYYLAIVGGTHPDSVGDLTIDTVLQAWGRGDPNRLMITGYVPRETVDLYHAATDICLAPYNPVGLSASAALTWALTSGRPTIASRIPAFQELNAESDCLAMVTPGAVQELVWQIKRVCTDEALRERLVTGALRHAARYSWESVSDQLLAVYEELAPQAACPAAVEAR